MYLIIFESILIITGLLGIILPSLPGIPLIFAGVLIRAIQTDFSEISKTLIIIFGILTVLSLVIDYLFTYFGAKIAKTTQLGALGGLIGLIVGIAFSPFGFFSIFIAPVLGTIIGELIAGRKILQSSKSGIYVLISIILSIMINFTIASWMIFIFIRSF